MDLIEKGDKGSLHRYEATKKGVDVFRAWLRESVAVAPALRDVLHATLALVGDEDLPWLVEAIEVSGGVMPAAERTSTAPP